MTPRDRRPVELLRLQPGVESSGRIVHESALKAQKMSSNKHREIAQLSVFLTDMGWFGIWGTEFQLSGSTIGHSSDEKVRDAVRASFDELLAEKDWFPDLRIRLQKYAQGVRADFADIDLLDQRRSEFQHRVLNETRRIPFGHTLTYGQIADRSGSPKAARAVGSVMASNHFPIIIPCHRVVAAGGRIGGFSAPQGVGLKERMLMMESACCGQMA